MRYKVSLTLLLLASIGIVSAADQAPDFVGLGIIDEQPLRLSDYRGKVVFIDFWASWCPPCLVSLPAYEQMRAEIGIENFEIIAINVDEDPANGVFLPGRSSCLLSRVEGPGRRYWHSLWGKISAGFLPAGSRRQTHRILSKFQTR